MLKNLLSIILLVVSFTSVAATEDDYVKRFCVGEQEFVLSDRTRVDCLLDDYAVEYDWSVKWYQGITQSLHYAMHTGKKAGLVLIVKDQTQDGQTDKYTIRAKRLISHYRLPIKLWVVDRGKLIEVKLP